MASIHTAPARGTRVLVSGASGFIGAHLVTALVSAGCEVVTLLRPESDLWRLESSLARFDSVTADVAAIAPDELARDIGPVQLVYHLAAAGVDPARGDAKQVVHTNTLGTLRMLQLGRALDAGRFVYCGSCFEYGGGSRLRENQLPAPRSEYGASKAAAWMLSQTFSRRHGLPVASVRPFTVYGPLEAEHRLVPTVVRTALAGDAIELTGGEQRRDFVFVRDAVDGFLRAGVSPAAAGGTFNLCTGAPVSVREIVSAILELTGSSSEPIYGARVHRATDVPTLSGHPGAARRALGWSAKTSLRDGLRETIQWLRSEAAARKEVSVA